MGKIGKNWEKLGKIGKNWEKFKNSKFHKKISFAEKQQYLGSSTTLPQTPSVPASAEGVLLPAPSCSSLNSIALNSGEYPEPVRVIQSKYISYLVPSEPPGIKRGGAVPSKPPGLKRGSCALRSTWVKEAGAVPSKPPGLKRGELCPSSHLG